jgi:hypothetical protein
MTGAAISEPPAPLLTPADAIEQLLGPAFHVETRILLRLFARKSRNPLNKIKKYSLEGGSSISTFSIILLDLAFEKPRFFRKSSRSSSLRATICCRAALMPFTNPCGEELANRQRLAASGQSEAAYSSDGS